MTGELDKIVQNAQEGVGPCKGCPSHEQMEGELVNPGLGNPDGDIVFVTEEPRHLTDWSKYGTWAAYNEEWWPRIKRARGGQFVGKLLSETDYTLDDIWFADSIKCPTKADPSREIPAADTDETFSHCYPYLRTEIARIDPEAIVTLGKGATIRTHQVCSSEPKRASRIRVTKDYGRSHLTTDYPVIISLHWAQRTIAQDEWVPVVQDALASAVSAE